MNDAFRRFTGLKSYEQKDVATDKPLRQLFGAEYGLQI